MVEADGCSWVARWVSTHLDLGVAAGQGRIAWILVIDVGRRRLGWKELLDRAALPVGDEDGRGRISPRKTMAAEEDERWMGSLIALRRRRQGHRVWTLADGLLVEAATGSASSRGGG
ncbi:hypothetical protein ACLOJK_000105 [Asimina triloba]